MKKLCNYLAAACLLVCGCIFAFETQARVCFATDENCGSGGNFATIDKEGIKKKCTDEGYILASDCRAQVGMQVTEYCPYDHRYAMCCGLEYAYTKCTYPLKPDGYCGGKYKCACDTVKYPFAQKTATVCTNTVSNADYDNSIASGGSCAYTGYDQATKTSTVNLRFTKCACDRGLYPKTADECAKNTAGTSQDSCTDSEGNQYFANCICTDEFKKYAEECTYGIDVNGPKCTQGDTIKVKECCTCNRATYPYSDQTAEGVKSFESCAHKKGCSRGDVYRATACNLGYKLGNGSDTGKCVPKTCGGVVQDYLTSKGGNYVLYNDAAPTGTNVIVGDSTTKAYWRHFAGKKVISGLEYASTLYAGDSLVKLMKIQCAEAPTIKMADTSNYTSYSTFDFSGVILKSDYAFINSSSGVFNCTNCGIVIKKISSKGKMNLNYNSTKANADNMYVNVSDTMEISEQFIATGYDFDVNYMDITSNNIKHNFIGRAPTDRNTFKVYKLAIRQALAMLKNMNARVSYTYMGIPYNNNMKNAVGQTWYYTKYQGCGNDNNYYRTGFFDGGDGIPSALHLYDSTYTIGEQLWMSSSTRIGQGLNDGSGLPESGSIVFSRSSSRTFTNLFYPLPTSTGDGYSVKAIDQNGNIVSKTYANDLLRFRHNKGSGSGSIDSYCYFDSQAIPHDGMGEHRKGGHGGSSGCRSGKCRYFHDCGSGDCRITDDDRDCKATHGCYVFRYMNSGTLKAISKGSIYN